MAVELLASDEFARWFEWMAAADPEVAREVANVVEVYSAKEEHLRRVAFDVCVSPGGRVAFVVAHLGGVVFLASGAEIEGSDRRVMTMVSRARKVARRMQQGRLELQPWEEVRKWLRGGVGAVSVRGAG